MQPRINNSSRTTHLDPGVNEAEHAHRVVCGEEGSRRQAAADSREMSGGGTGASAAAVCRQQQQALPAEVCMLLVAMAMVGVHILPAAQPGSHMYSLYSSR